MNLFDMLNRAQGGNDVQSLGKQFGLTPDQTQAAVEALMPAFNRGLQQQASTPQGLGALLTMLAGGQNLQGADAGNGVLGQLFGSKDLSRAVAAQASQASGVGQDVLKKMLPALASMLMGAIAKQTNQHVQSGTFGASNPLGDIIEQMMRQGGGQATRPSSQSNNPLGDILGQILGGGQQQAQPRRQQAPAGSGNPLEDILGQILKGGGQGGPAPQGNNPLGDILDQILKGGQRSDPGYQPDDAPQAPPQRRTTRQQPQQGQARNPLEDILGQILNPGGQAQTQPQGRPSGPAQDPSYQEGMDNIFDQFRRGVERYRP